MSFSALRKALATGIVTVAGMLAAHHDITLAAKAIFVVGTVFYTTFQLCHDKPPSVQHDVPT